MGVIYSITSPSGKLYVGKTYHVKKRIACHKCASKKGGTIILHNSIKKYGWDNHLFSVLETVEDSQLDVREMFWIATLKTYCYENTMGMNMTRGGDGQRNTWMHDTERRAKASIRFSGENNPFHGRKHTEEAKKILGDKASKRNKKNGYTVPDWGTKKRTEMCSKKVAAYNLKGEIVAKYKSCSEAARVLGLNTGDVSGVARGEYQQSNDYIFKYYEKEPLLYIDVTDITFKRSNIPIVLLDFNGHLIKEYKSARQAHNELHIRIGNINRAAKEYKGKPLRSGHCFMYKDEWEEKQRNQLN